MGEKQLEHLAEHRVVDRSVRPWSDSAVFTEGVRFERYHHSTRPLRVEAVARAEADG